ncbi:helix-turn-helix domain-containing protein [Vibrio litoralis]|uniref:helix-turn-helix domain-containing protein n=1 Tax=Vibrio litoralis TaxID=335972 RepID=UPI000A001BEE
MSLNAVSSLVRADQSRRTIHYNFERCLGISPIQYIKNNRLNAIRLHLLNNIKITCISDLALEHGFFHTSAFND